MPFSWTTRSSSFMRYFAQIHLIPTPKQWGGYFKFPCHQISHSLLLPGWQSPNWDNNVPRFKTNYGDAFGSPLHLGAGGVCLSGMVLAREMSSERWVWPPRKLSHWGWPSWHRPFCSLHTSSPHLDLIILGSWNPCSRLPRMKIKDTPSKGSTGEERVQPEIAYLQTSSARVKRNMISNWHSEWFLQRQLCREQKAGKEKNDIPVRSSLYTAFDAVGLFGNHMFSGELRKCHYRCKTNTKEFLLAWKSLRDTEVWVTLIRWLTSLLSHCPLPFSFPPTKWHSVFWWDCHWDWGPEIQWDFGKQALYILGRASDPQGDQVASTF